MLGGGRWWEGGEVGGGVGAKGEVVGAARVDEVRCAFGVLGGGLRAGQEDVETGCCAVYALFDNEEIGSGTKQGADSTFLEDVLWRINEAAGGGREDYLRRLAASFMVSADKAHGVHPNYGEKADPTHRPWINGGMVS